MSDRPTIDIIDWANQDVQINLDDGLSDNKVPLEETRKTIGWEIEQKPSPTQFNYQMNLIAQWLKYLRQEIDNKTTRFTLVSELYAYLDNAHRMNSPIIPYDDFLRLEKWAHYGLPGVFYDHIGKEFINFKKIKGGSWYGFIAFPEEGPHYHTPFFAFSGTLKRQDEFGIYPHEKNFEPGGWMLSPYTNINYSGYDAGEWVGNYSTFDLRLFDIHQIDFQRDFKSAALLNAGNFKSADVIFAAASYIVSENNIIEDNNQIGYQSCVSVYLRADFPKNVGVENQTAVIRDIDDVPEVVGRLPKLRHRLYLGETVNYPTLVDNEFVAVGGTIGINSYFLCMQNNGDIYFTNLGDNPIPTDIALLAPTVQRPNAAGSYGKLVRNTLTPENIYVFIIIYAIGETDVFGYTLFNAAVNADVGVFSAEFSWDTELDRPLGRCNEFIYVIERQRYLALFENCIAYTDNEGQLWSIVDLGAGRNFKNLAIADNGFGLLNDGESIWMRTFDYGESWEEFECSIAPCGICYDDDRGRFLAASDGQIFECPA